MGAAFVFIFRSSMVMLAMYLVYKALLSGEKQHAYNRGLLLAMYVLSPVIVVLAAAVSLPSVDVPAQEGLTGQEMLELMMANADLTPSGTSSSPLWARIMLGIWIAGMVAVAASTAYSWIKVRRILKGCDMERRDGYVLALSPDAGIAPFSLRRTVVMSRRDYKEAGDMILTHELRHIGCRHWIDIAVARVVDVLAWFNPASWLMDEELRMVHEYQADAAVLSAGADARSYQMLLIKKAAGRSFPAIANSLNHSNLKKRITMMIKSKSAKGRRWRSLALVPAVASVLVLADIPAVASALAVIDSASLSEGKVTQKSAERETKTVPMDSIRNLPPEAVESVTFVTGEKSDKIVAVPTDPNQPVMEATYETKKRDSYVGSPAVFIDGKEATTDELTKIEPSRIKSMKVDKSDDAYPNGAIYVELNDAKGDAAMTLPQFKGGDGAMMSWIMTHVKMPEVKDAPEKARVIVEFVIDENGKVGDAKIMRGSIDEYNAEALRVVSEMPDFIPATENGKPVATTYALPITFAVK